MFSNFMRTNPSRDSRLHAAFCRKDNEWAMSSLSGRTWNSQHFSIVQHSHKNVGDTKAIVEASNFCHTRSKGIQDVHKMFLITFSPFFVWSGQNLIFKKRFTTFSCHGLSIDNLCSRIYVVLQNDRPLHESCQKSNKKSTKTQQPLPIIEQMKQILPEMTQPNWEWWIEHRKKRVEPNGQAWQKARHFTTDSDRAHYFFNSVNHPPQNDWGTSSSPMQQLCLRHTTELEAQWNVQQNHNRKLLRQQHFKTASALPTRSPLASTGMSRPVLYGRPEHLAIPPTSATVNQLVAVEMSEHAKMHLHCETSAVVFV